jgi:hypothetical protein
MKKFEEEPKPGIPAFMTTFADLMTLLLVFFILLNVYAQEKQAGLIAAASGSFARALRTNLGLGGLLGGSQYLDVRQHARPRWGAREEGGEPVTETRRGDEIDLRKEITARLEATEEVSMAASFTFAHADAELPPEGRHYLDALARSLQGGDFVLELQARASFHESLRPMELACRRITAITGYLRKIGVAAVIEPQAAVVSGTGAVDGPASYRGLELRIVRRR